MFKPGPNYKMTKPTKVMLANILDPHKRGAIKKSMIEAELAAAHKPKSSKNKKDSAEE